MSRCVLWLFFHTLYENHKPMEMLVSDILRKFRHYELTQFTSAKIRIAMKGNISIPL